MAAAFKEVWLFDHGEIGGGGQRFALRLAGELAGRGVDVRTVCEPGGTLSAWCRDAGIEVTEASAPAPFGWRLPSVVAAVSGFRRLLRSMPAGSVAIGNHPRSQAYLYAASRGLAETPAVVHVVHERETAARVSARFVYRRFGGLVVIGANAAEEYRSRLPGVPIEQANNFLPSAAFRAVTSATRRRGSSPVLGVLARMIPEKGIAELVDELDADETRTLWSELRVAAPFQDAAYVSEVERRIEANGLGDRISLLGEVADLPAFLSSIDLLVVPSTGNEAQPTAILEALAGGLPVILRAPLWSGDYAGLPVARYERPGELAGALRSPPDAAASSSELERRFGPDQLIAALARAAQAARARS